MELQSRLVAHFNMTYGWAHHNCPAPTQVPDEYYFELAKRQDTLQPTFINTDSVHHLSRVPLQKVTV